jgi:hypothetical protein
MYGYSASQVVRLQMGERWIFGAKKFLGQLFTQDCIIFYGA